MFEIIVAVAVFLMLSYVYVSTRQEKSSYKLFWQTAAAKKKPADSIMQKTGYSQGSSPGVSFIGQLQTEIEASMPPRPTDSILKRHHDSMVAQEISKRLEFFS